MMANCSENVTYPTQQLERLKDISINNTATTVLTVVGIVVNIFLAVLIIANGSLRQKSLGTLKLCIFNAGECIFTLYNLTKLRSEPDKVMHQIYRSVYYMPMLTFFVAGQIIAVAIVTIERIQLVSGIMTSVNSVTRDPSRGKDCVKKAVLIIIAVAVNALLSGLVPHLKYVIGSFVFINCFLYVVLIIRLTSLKSLLNCNLSSISKKALLYVSCLFVGFIFEFMLFFIRRSNIAKYAKRGCIRALTRGMLSAMYLYALQFVWEPAAYLFFNAAPRVALRRTWKRIFCKNFGVPQNVNCAHRAAPIFVEEIIQPCPNPPEPTAVVPQEIELKPTCVHSGSTPYNQNNL